LPHWVRMGLWRSKGLALKRPADTPSLLEAGYLALWGTISTGLSRFWVTALEFIPGRLAANLGNGLGDPVALVCGAQAIFPDTLQRDDFAFALL
jgi:hypothetical protein